MVGYGHLGDGNLHLNVSCAKYEGAILDRIEPYVYEWTAARRGSISAEHGLGQMKAECIGCVRRARQADPALRRAPMPCCVSGSAWHAAHARACATDWHGARMPCQCGLAAELLP